MYIHALYLYIHSNIDKILLCLTEKAEFMEVVFFKTAR